MMLNKFEKENLVVKLLDDGKTIREVAREAHVSFRDIGVIARKVKGEVEVQIQAPTTKTLETQALALFAEGKSQIDVATELDISPRKVTKIYKEFLRLSMMQKLVNLYEQSKLHLSSLLKLHDTMMEYNMTNKDLILAIENLKELPYAQLQKERLQAKAAAFDQQKYEQAGEIEQDQIQLLDYTDNSSRCKFRQT
jgi:AraC-like DNA-binding protein